VSVVIEYQAEGAQWANQATVFVCATRSKIGTFASGIERLMSTHRGPLNILYLVYDPPPGFVELCEPPLLQMEEQIRTATLSPGDNFIKVPIPSRGAWTRGCRLEALLFIDGRLAAESCQSTEQ
jgi:hypothetical protein